MDAGLPGLYFAGDVHGTWMSDPAQPLDAGVRDPPPPPRGHEWEPSFPGIPVHENPRAFLYDKTFADWVLSGCTTGIRQHPCVVPGFDNTPCSGRRGGFSCTALTRAFSRPRSRRRFAVKGRCRARTWCSSSHGTSGGRRDHGARSVLRPGFPARARARPERVIQRLRPMPASIPAVAGGAGARGGRGASRASTGHSVTGTMPGGNRSKSPK
jgi:hypothetical protein